MYGHRPLYCSNVDDMPDCSSDAETLRFGINDTSLYGLEVILMKYNVDLYLCGHEHSYERSFPVFNGTVQPQDTTHYLNPLYPIYIVTGSAGCQEGFDYYDKVFYGPYSAFRSSSYGYGHLTVYNSTHLYWDQYLDEGRSGTDYFWIEKESTKIAQQ